MSTFFEWVKKMIFWVFLVLVVGVIVGMTRSLFGFIGTTDRFSQAEMEVQKLEEERLMLEENLKNIDEEFVAEKELRDSLGLSKPGEKVVVLPEEMLEKALESRKQDDALQKELKNWQKWWKLFF